MAKNLIVIISVALMALFSIDNAAAATTTQHKVVIQISTIDPMTQRIALNNAMNLQSLYGEDDITIEIVAYGPGISLLTVDSNYADTVDDLIMRDITFSACLNTMHNIERKTGKLPVLLDDVTTVKSGVARIMELQEAGYSYIRP